MARTVVGLFDDLAQAQNVVDELMLEGFTLEAISLVARNEGDELETETPTDVVNDAVAEGAGQGATVGTVLGGTLGLLVGLGALVIPGIGPVIAAGSLASALGSAALGAGVGAAAGGLAGGLSSVGIHPNDLSYYAEGIRQGGVLVAVNAESDQEVETAQAVLHRHGGRDIDRRMSSALQHAANIDKVPLRPTPDVNEEEDAAPDAAPAPQSAEERAQADRRLV